MGCGTGECVLQPGHFFGQWWACREGHGLQYCAGAFLVLVLCAITCVSEMKAPVNVAISLPGSCSKT